MVPNGDKAVTLKEVSAAANAADASVAADALPEKVGGVDAYTEL